MLCLQGATGSVQAQEQRLGRLFHTPEERAKLDQKRGVVSAPANTASQTAIVNGMITRNGQAAVLFIDGKESRGSDTKASGLQQLNQGVPLIGEGGKPIAGKPGQIVDLSSGKAMEAYQLVPGVAQEAGKESPAAGPNPSAMDPATGRRDAAKPPTLPTAPSPSR